MRARVGHRLRYVRYALQLVWSSSPGWAAANMALLVAQGLLPVLAIYLVKLMLDTVSRGADFSQVVGVIALAGGVTLLSHLLSAVASLVMHALRQDVADRAYELIHTQSAAVDLAYYEDAQFFNRLYRAQAEAGDGPVEIVNGLAIVAQSGVALLGMAGLLLSLHWSVSLLLGAAVIPSIVARLRFARQRYQTERDLTEADRRAWYLHWILTGNEHAREVRAFDLGRLFTAQFQAVRQGIHRRHLGLEYGRTLSELVAQALATLAVFTSFAVIAYQTIDGSSTIGDLVMYYQIFQRGQGYLHSILQGLAHLYERSLFLTDFYEFLNLGSRILIPPDPEPVPNPIQSGLVFEEVGFSYPGDGRQTLCGVNFAIRPGELVALVGENGSGKTTILKLINRLYDPTAGAIFVDGIDLRQFDPAVWRRQVSVVFQDYAHYALTARQNIALGSVHTVLSDDQITAAARAAHIHQLIMSLEAGYDTLLGNLFDGSHELSIGQWQRIALARAFLRDAQVFLFDEPISAIDPQAEHDVIQRLQQVCRGRTMLLVSHRLSTARIADRILVLQHGRIIEQGTHHDLLALGGHYARLFDLQAHHYR